MMNRMWALAVIFVPVPQQSISIQAKFGKSRGKQIVKSISFAEMRKPCLVTENGLAHPAPERRFRITPNVVNKVGQVSKMTDEQTRPNELT